MLETGGDDGSDRRGRIMKHRFIFIPGRFQSEPAIYHCTVCNKEIGFMISNGDRKEECAGYVLRIWSEVEL